MERYVVESLAAKPLCRLISFKSSSVMSISMTVESSVEMFRAPVSVSREEEVFVGSPRRVNSCGCTEEAFTVSSNVRERIPLSISRSYLTNVGGM